LEEKVEISGQITTIRERKAANPIFNVQLGLVIHMQFSVKAMLKRLGDLLILGTVSVVYSMAVFCLKRRQA